MCVQCWAVFFFYYFFFAFSSYLEWQRPFRANPGKKELVERNSVDLALRVGGCTKEFKGRLKNDCNTLMNLSLSLSLSLFSVSLLFFSWTKSYASWFLLFFVCIFQFLFEPTCSHLEEGRTWLSLFPPRSWMSMQRPEIAQMGSLHVFFCIFQQHSLPQCIVTICVKKKSP